MVRRVIGIPDRNGIIAISCGGDIVEIHVISDFTPPSSGSSNPTMSGTGDTDHSINPFSEPFAGIMEGIKDNPFDLPFSYIRSTTVGGKIDTASIVKQVLDRIADQDQDNPSAVILDLNNANLHELSELGQKMSSQAPDVPIVVDFGGLLKR